MSRWIYANGTVAVLKDQVQPPASGVFVPTIPPSPGAFGYDLSDAFRQSRIHLRDGL